MAFDRRTLLLAAAGAIASVGCSWAKPAPSAVSSGSWYMLKGRFFTPDGRIVDTGNGGISHSEGQGYGMLLAVMADDRPSFDAMHRWTEATLLRDDMALFSWRYDPAQQPPVSDPNNASDGDILIAWALMIAGERWGDRAYRDRARQIRRAIRANLVVERHGLQVLLPGLNGFDLPERTTLNPAYYIWPALEAFREEDGERQWGRLIKDGDTMLARARFGALALPTDWIDLMPDTRIEPAMGRPARFGFDAVRVPLYLSMAGRIGQTADFAHFWSAYLDQDRAIPAWVDVQTGETAPYPLSKGGLDIVARVTGRTIALPDPAQEQDYYSTVLSTLAALPNFP